MRKLEKVFLLEDYEPSRELVFDALKHVFGDVEIAESETVFDAFDKIKKNTFDLAILDINLPDGSGIDVIRRIRTLSPETYCVVSTVFDDDRNLFESLKAGAHGYLLKQESRGDFVRHLNGILGGVPPLSSVMAQRMIAHFNGSCAVAEKKREIRLTPREEQVLQLIAKGHSRKRIAIDLEISLHTTNDYVKTIYRKLNVSSSVEATLLAIEHGIAEQAKS